MATVGQSNSFNARLGRINDPRNVSYFDPETGMNIPKRLSKQLILKKSKKKSLASAVLASLVLGAVAMLAISVGFHRVGLVDQWYPMLTMMSGALAALLIGQLFKLNRLPHLIAQFVGLIVTMSGFHNLVLLFPDQFAVLYSPALVAKVQAATELGSIVFLGQNYTF